MCDQLRELVTRSASRWRPVTPTSEVFAGTKSCGNFNMANFVAFHSLLQNFLYPSTRRISRLISRPWGGCGTRYMSDSGLQAKARQTPPHSPPVVYAQRANLSASAPHCGMPLGKSSFWPFLAFSSSLASRLP